MLGHHRFSQLPVHGRRTCRVLAVMSRQGTPSRDIPLRYEHGQLLPARHSSDGEAHSGAQAVSSGHQRYLGNGVGLWRGKTSVRDPCHCSSKFHLSGSGVAIRPRCRQASGGGARITRTQRCCDVPRRQPNCGPCPHSRFDTGEHRWCLQTCARLDREGLVEVVIIKS